MILFFTPMNFAGMFFYENKVKVEVHVFNHNLSGNSKCVFLTSQIPPKFHIFIDFDGCTCKLGVSLWMSTRNNLTLNQHVIFILHKSRMKWYLWKQHLMVLRIHDKKRKFPFWKSNIDSTASTGTRTIAFIWRLEGRLTCESVQSYLVYKPHSAMFFFCWHKISNFVKGKCTNFMQLTLTFIEDWYKRMFIRTAIRFLPKCKISSLWCIVELRRGQIATSNICIVGYICPPSVLQCIKSVIFCYLGWTLLIDSIHSCRLHPGSSVLINFFVSSFLLGYIQHLTVVGCITSLWLNALQKGMSPHLKAFLKYFQIKHTDIGVIKKLVNLMNLPWSWHSMNSQLSLWVLQN